MNCNWLIKWILALSIIIAFSIGLLVAYFKSPVKNHCDCCGIPIADTAPYCMTCYKDICSDCLICTYNCSWYRDDFCLICLAKEEYSFTKEQQERLEMIYSIGGFQYNQAKQKVENMKQN